MPDAGPTTPEAGERIQGPPAGSSAVKGDGHVPTSEVGGDLPTAGAGSASFLSRQDSATIANILHTGGIGILDQLPDGVALLNHELRILWCNRLLYDFTLRNDSAAPARLCESVVTEATPGKTTRPSDALVGKTFYEAFGTPEIIGPDFCPLHTALGSGELAKSSLRVGEKTYFEVQARPVSTDGVESPNLLVVTVRDISAEVLQRQKLNAIYQAGLELGDLSLDDILQMSVDERIDLLKSKILHYTQDLLRFETVEIRLLDKSTRHLEPLLAVGMEPGAASRPLRADPQGNGVTGFVAATGKSYLCEDTTTDPLYLPGAPAHAARLPFR